MNDRPSGWVRSFINRAQAAEAPHPVPPDRDNVVQLPIGTPDLDDRKLKIRNLDAKLMSIAIDIDRLGLQFNSVRDELMREREAFLNDLKDEGVISHYAHTPPKAEFLEPAP